MFDKLIGKIAFAIAATVAERVVEEILKPENIARLALSVSESVVASLPIPAFLKGQSR